MGINTAIASRGGGNDGIGFAIPINLARTVMKNLIETGTVVRGWLGVSIQNLDLDLAASFDFATTRGVLIGDVEPRSPAERAGLKPGDIGTAVDNVPMENSSDLRNRVAVIAPGATVVMEVFRDGASKSFAVEIGTRPGASVTGLADVAARYGVEVDDVTVELSKAFNLSTDRGAVVTCVAPVGSAARAGLEVGDVILKVQDQKISSAAEFTRELNHPGDDTARLQVQRGTHKRSVLLKLGE